MNIVHVDVFDTFWDSEVGDLADTRGLHEDVVRFQILDHQELDILEKKLIWTDPV